MKKVALLFGGPSNEHEVSIESAKNIVNNFPYKDYKLFIVYWDKKGDFYHLKNLKELKKNRKKIRIEDFKNYFSIAFLVTHGKFGEDGILQSILESQKIKYCGCRPLSSALCMDKGVFKQYLSGRGINQVKFSIFDYDLDNAKEIRTKINRIKSDFKLPVYIKPANSGSSVGISKVTKFSQINQALKEALKHDNRVIVEEGIIDPKEVEIAVLGNKELNISLPGELVLAKDFYDYEDKYKKGEAKVVIPALLPLKIRSEIILLAKKVYKLCGCSGFVRIDFFIKKNKIYLNEINTLPGFTKFSMYPMLMMNTGMSYKNLVKRIIDLAY